MTKTIKDIEDVVARVKCPGYQFNVVGIAYDNGPANYIYLQVVGVTGTYRWQGRKWLLSPHMTDGEIVQTCLLATISAQEHEIRETFFYRGEKVFDPHYDIEKLVELRSQNDSIKERDHPGSV